MRSPQETVLMNSAVRALSRRAHTMQEIREKLRKLPQHTPELEQNVLQRLQDLGFLNDQAIILRAIERAKDSKFEGLTKISQRLVRKGIPMQDIKSLWQQTITDEESIAQKALEKYEHKLLKLNTQQRIEKKARFLYSRGFSPDICFELAKKGERL